MTVGASRSRLLPLVGLAIMVSTLAACPSDKTTTAIAPLSIQQGGIPAPTVPLTDASPVSDFLTYGDGLQFAPSSPGSVIISRTRSGGTSELRVRSELRLQNTDSAAYATGRIIAKFETIGAASDYGVPIGNAYLWVIDTGGGHHKGVLMWRAYVTGDTGRTAIASQMHSDPRTVAVVQSECFELTSAVSDSTRMCCLCGDGRYNCPMAQALSMAQLDSLLTAAGRVRRP